MVVGRNKNPLDWHGEPMRYAFAGQTGYLPLECHDSDSLTAIYPADFVVSAALPSEAITPLRWLDGRARLLIAAYWWRRITWSGPDGSSGQLDPTPTGRSALRPSPASGAQGPADAARAGNSGILELRVTSREARDGGRHIFGVPKLLADMDSPESLGLRTVPVSEQGDGVLTLLSRSPFAMRALPIEWGV